MGAFLTRLWILAVQEFAELAEDQPGHVASLDVLQHPLGFRVGHDRFAADRFQMIDLDHVPVLGFRVTPSPLLVMLGAVTFSLVLRGNSYPDAD